jgi:SEC-C motif-containing protein
MGTDGIDEWGTMKKFDKCPCGSGALFTECCSGIVDGRRKAQTAEQLMRSRYTAYVMKNVDHLVRTTHPDEREADLADAIRRWMRQVEWIKLHVVATEAGSATEQAGRVEFIAEYVSGAGPGRHHECSVFKKHKGDWFYAGEEDSEPDS